MKKVCYSRCFTYQPEDLHHALQEIIAPLPCGAPGALQSKKVMIKPNLLSYRRQDDIAAVNPALLLETVKILRELGCAEIAIIENPATVTCPTIIKSMGLESPLQELGVKVANCARYTDLELPPPAKFHQLALATEFQDYDLVVNLGRIKTHAMMTLTMAVKNLFGLVRGADRIGWHLAVGCDYARFAELLIDIYLQVQPQLNIFDGICCMEGNGPGSGSPAWRHFLVASDDAVALDDAVAKKFSQNELWTIAAAKARKLVLPYSEIGGNFALKPLQLPDPPGKLLEWGVYLPPYFKTKLRNLVSSHPVVDKTRCIGCGRCVKMCPPQSLKLDAHGKPRFDLDHCIRCYCCQEHCPKGAIFPRQGVLMKWLLSLEKLIRH